MNLHRCSSVFHICRQSSPPKLLSHFKSSISSLAHPSPTSSSSSLQIRLFWLNHPLRTRTRAFTTAVSSVPDGNVTTAASSVPDGNVSDTFFAEEGVSWTSVGVSDVLSRSLSNVGIERPSLVQAACIPTILSGKDVVIAAETGSGKTHGYLVPLFEKLYGTPYDSGSTTAGQEWSLPRKVSVVLCPNVMLCDQVVRMANGLCDDNGDPILRVSAICGRQGWPAHMPDIVVSTPAALLNNLRSIDPEKRRLSDFIRGVKYVVFDEADLLLCGSFQNQVVRLINMFRFDEKQLSRSKTSIPKEPLEFDSESLLQLDPEYEEDLQGNATLEGDENVEHGVGVEDEIDSARAKRKDWRRVRKYYERSKQYIFVAATLPVNGKQTAGGILKRMFPDANWVSGTYLHCHNPRLKHQWVEVTVDTQVGALIDALDEGSRSKLLSSGGVSRTIVFANTVEAVEAVAKILQGAGIECFHYHSDSSLEERAKTLVDFQKQGGILVCTDAASRGLDIPKVSHVIQADFATSALDFLHRVGRAGRAGQFGLVTSMYTESNRDLVNAIRQAWKLGQPVEMAFSRKRSFRKKIKKRGYNKAAEILTAEEKVAA